MNRIEAIYVMLQGKTVAIKGSNINARMYYCTDNKQFMYIFGDKRTSKPEPVNGALDTNKGYEIYNEPKKKVTLYRYTWKRLVDDKIEQTAWTSDKIKERFTYPDRVVKTETKEVELD